MRWRNQPRSTNVEDRRDVRVHGRTATGAGLLGLLPSLIRFFGFKKVIIGMTVLLGIAYFTGTLDNVMNAFVAPSSQEVTQETVPLRQTPEEKELVDFVSVILADTEQTWA